MGGVPAGGIPGAVGDILAATGPTAPMPGGGVPAGGIPGVAGKILAATGPTPLMPAGCGGGEKLICVGFIGFRLASPGPPVPEGVPPPGRPSVEFW